VLAALSRHAHASTGEERMYHVVAAFGVLVVAATLTSVAAARRRRDATPASAEPDDPARQYADERGPQCAQE